MLRKLCQLHAKGSAFGRVSTADVFGVSNFDLIPGKYEGGLKLWESSFDLVNTLQREIRDGQLSLRGKRVLESKCSYARNTNKLAGFFEMTFLGCGQGFPGIFACLKGALSVHFQDFNAEVLRCLTIPNVYANLQHARELHGRHCDGPITPTRTTSLSPDVHFYAGNWGELHTVLSVVGQNQLDSTCDISSSFSEGDLFLDHSNSHDGSGGNRETHKDSNHSQQVRRTRKLSGSRACERASDSDPSQGGYDIILMAETVYSLVSMQKLYGLIKQCLRPPYGVLYLAAKKHYFGVGGGPRQFRSLVEEEGILGAHLVVEFTDGSLNVREIWKFFFNMISRVGLQQRKYYIKNRSEGHSEYKSRIPAILSLYDTMVVQHNTSVVTTASLTIRVKELEDGQLHAKVSLSRANF
eukprot:Gb_41160 [translate_table: standard]